MSYSTDVRATGAIDEADLSADEQPQVRNMRQRLQLAVVNPWKHITSGDVSGSLGDLGTFLPLTVALVGSVGLDLGTTLVFSGVYNVYSGAAFGVPIPVQPMKSIAAVAITEDGISLSQMLLAGFLVSATVFVLGVTRLIDWANRAVPQSIIRGIQVGIGLKLAIRGFKLALFSGPGNEWRGWTGSEGLILSLTAAVYLLLTVVKRARAPDSAQACDRDSCSSSENETVGSHKQEESHLDSPNKYNASENVCGSSSRGDMKSQGGDSCVCSVEVELATSTTEAEASHAATRGRRRSCIEVLAWKALLVARTFPPALLVVLVGLGIAIVVDPKVLSGLRLGPSVPKILSIKASDWKPAVIRAALPQLPLTILNSVVAVTMLSQELFPAVPVSMVHMAVSVGVMNAVGPWFGCMPCCHGAGGLAAQARFGAKSGVAPMLLGAAKACLGLMFGSSLFELFQVFPESLLGVMLVLSGVELASTASKLPQEKPQWLLMMITAAVCMAKDTGAGFLVGFLSSLIVRPWPWMKLSPTRATP